MMLRHFAEIGCVSKVLHTAQIGRVRELLPTAN